MPIIQAEQWKSDWLPTRKICLYPAFDRLFQTQMPGDGNPYSSLNYARKAVSEIKLLLLFFDLVDAGFHTVFTPINRQAELVFSKLVQSTDFIDLCQCGLIPVEVWSDGGLETAACDYQQLLFSCGVDERLGLLDCLRKFDQDRIIQFFHPSPEVPIPRDVLDAAFFAMSENTMKLPQSDIDQIFNEFENPSSAGWEDVVRFQVKLSQLPQTDSVIKFCKRVGLSIYECGDQYPGRFPVPFLGRRIGDSPLRMSPSSGILPILNSPSFFQQLLLLIVPPFIANRVGLLRPHDLLDLHCQPFWRDHADSFAIASKKISHSLVGLSEEEIEALTQEEALRHYKLRDSRSVTLFELIYGGIFFLLHLPFLSFSAVAASWLERMKQRSHLLIEHRSLYHMSRWLDGRIRERLQSH